MEQIIRRLTREEIVAETVEYYSKNPRGIGPDGCVYLIDDPEAANCGARCALGRCLTDGPWLQWKGGVVTLARHLATGVGHDEVCTSSDPRLGEAESLRVALDAALLPQYRGHSLTFWRALQKLHDTSTAWINSYQDGAPGRGLNERGYQLALAACREELVA